MEKVYLDNFSIVLDSFKCNRNCPYCIAKNDKRFTFEGNEDFTQLDSLFKKISKQQIHFRKVMILGNGEPALYPYEELNKIVKAILNNKELFDKVRLYTSGIVFNKTRVFNLFNNLSKQGIDCEFVPLIVTIDEKIDQSVLGHKSRYLNTNNFKKAKVIKLDIALTDYLNIKTFISDIKTFLDNNYNISTVKFRILRLGKDLNSKQSQWGLKHAYSKEQIVEFKKLISDNFAVNGDPINCNYKGAKFGFGKERTPSRFVVWAKNKLMDFYEDEIRPEDIRTLHSEKNLGVYGSNQNK